jgi:hypothetical protein
MSRCNTLKRMKTFEKSENVCSSAFRRLAQIIEPTA